VLHDDLTFAILIATTSHKSGGPSPMKSLRNPERKPTHPGAVLREDVLPELRWTQTKLANRLMVSGQTVSQLLHEERAVTAEMAIRISGAVGGTPESWLGMQQAVDLWEAGIKLQSNPALAPLFQRASVAV